MNLRDAGEAIHLGENVRHTEYPDFEGQFLSLTFQQSLRHGPNCPKALLQTDIQGPPKNRQLEIGQFIVRFSQWERIPVDPGDAK